MLSDPTNNSDLKSNLIKAEAQWIQSEKIKKLSIIKVKFSLFRGGVGAGVGEKGKKPKRHFLG